MHHSNDNLYTKGSILCYKVLTATTLLVLPSNDQIMCKLICT